MVANLTDRYQAERVSSGVIRPFTIMEIWVSDRSDDWMIVTTEMNGSSCVIAHGEDYTRRDGEGERTANRVSEEVNPVAGMAIAPNVIP